jgi:hypothetical protein
LAPRTCMTGSLQPRIFSWSRISETHPLLVIVRQAKMPTVSSQMASL